MYNHINYEGKKYNKNSSVENVDQKQNNIINSERPNLSERLNNDESLDKKRKQSDMIIKKGKLLNLGSGGNSKGSSPLKPQGNDKKEDPQSLCNVSFSKNKRDLFNEGNGSKANQKSKQKQNIKIEKDESEEYANFLKYKEINSSELDNQNQSSGSYSKKQKSDKLREGSNKRYKTPTHIDNDQRDMKIILSQDYDLKFQDRKNSRNDFIVYNSNTGGSNNQKEELIKDLLNQGKVKDYIQMNRGGDLSIPATSIPNKKTFEKLSSDIHSDKPPNELNDFNFYTPSNVNNMIKNSSQNKMYVVNNHPLSGSAGYPRGLENDPAFWFRKSKSRIDDINEPGYSSRLNSCGYNRRSNVNKSSSFRNLKYSHRSDSNSRKKYPTNDPKNNSKRNQNTKSALSSYMAYKQGMNKKKSKKKQKKVPNQSNVNFFNNKKNSVDSVGNSINGPYLSPFFSSRDGRPSTIMKNHEGAGNMHIDLNSAISLLQYNMVTVDSMKSKKIKKVIPLKDRMIQKQPKKKNPNRSIRNDSASAGGRVSDAYIQERASLNHLKNSNSNSNNSFDPELYLHQELIHKNKFNGQHLTEGIQSVNESQSKDNYKSRNAKQVQHK